MIEKFILIAGFLLLMAACASKTPKLEPIQQKNPQVPQIEKKVVETSQLDLSSIQRLLNLDKNIQTLGFWEKSFNSCKVGYGYETSQNCQQKYFVVIHFKIACRASEGSVSTILTDDDLAVVANQNLQWFLKNTNGRVNTDSNGFAEIQLVSDISQRTERLRLSNGNDFVLMRAGEIRSLIVPINWCN